MCASESIYLNFYCEVPLNSFRKVSMVYDAIVAGLGGMGSVAALSLIHI